MITKKQLEDLSKFYGIDELTVFREYLQLIFLNYLYQQKEANSIYFKGGTAIRLFFDSPRFSEDLDFSTSFNKKEIKRIVEKTEESIQREMTDLHIFSVYSGRGTERFRIKYQPKEYKYPLTVRLDFHRMEKIGKTAVLNLTTKFPIIIFPVVSCLSGDEILAEKIQALLARSKGRDFFDVWYLLEKGVFTEKSFDREQLLKKIKQYPQNKLNRDLAQFLPKDKRSIIAVLKTRLEKQLQEVGSNSYRFRT